MTPLTRLPGTYMFIGRLATPAAVRVGSLGRIAFPAGDYAYVGSAFGPGGIDARVSHHLAISARPRWHLDYFRPHLAPVALWYTTDACPCEHAWAAALSGIRSAGLPCPGFGSSDCGCRSHLIYFRRMPTLATYRRHAHRPGRILPKEIRFALAPNRIKSG